MDSFVDSGHSLGEPGVMGDSGEDLSVCGDHGGVTPLEGLSYSGEGEVRDLAGQIHSNLAGNGGSGPTVAMEDFLDGGVECLGAHGHDALRRVR